ncbi:MAG TPA: PLP-dependent aminotransferase family protein, partial [Candidatus Binatia bacterium]|nr:PLP-dependent aminotransferase family protein [Candidatus Binatia bacterium]
MARTRTSSIPELLLAPLDRDGPIALHRQLERALQDAIRRGRLAPGSALPSTRALAEELGLSRGVVVEAYEQLAAEGYLESRRGGKTRVAPRAPAGADGPWPWTAAATRRRGAADSGAGAGGPRGIGPATAAVEAPGEDVILPFHAFTRLRYDFSYGRPDVTAFPRQAWLRSLRRVLNEAPADELSYLDGRGARDLREALAAYLNRVRATEAAASRVVVTNGFAQAQRLVLFALRSMGRKRIAMEDPGQADTRRAADLAGMEVVPVPVDDEGIRVDRLAEADVAMCVVTPAHAFPTGAVMSPERRAALVRWAEERDALVLEDDYDAEYRYDREPIGAIQGLAPESVVYAGSASKTLAPGLRLAWLILPARLVEPVATIKFNSDRGTPSLEQLTFADFLSRGEFDRHLRKMRPVYRKRRDALLGALARHLPELVPTGASAGLHVLAWLPPGTTPEREAAIVARAAELQVAIDGVSPMRSAPGPAGLVLGYARLAEREIEEGVARLAEAVRSNEPA